MAIDRKLIKGIVLEKYCLVKRLKNEELVSTKNLDFIISLVVDAIEQYVTEENKDIETIELPNDTTIKPSDNIVFKKTYDNNRVLRVGFNSSEDRDGFARLLDEYIDSVAKKINNSLSNT